MILKLEQRGPEQFEADLPVTDVFHPVDAVPPIRFPIPGIDAKEVGPLLVSSCNSVDSLPAQNGGHPMNVNGFVRPKHRGLELFVELEHDPTLLIAFR